MPTWGRRTSEYLAAALPLGLRVAAHRVHQRSGDLDVADLNFIQISGNKFQYL